MVSLCNDQDVEHYDRFRQSLKNHGKNYSKSQQAYLNPLLLSKLKPILELARQINS